jgi:hypothetical protein
MATRQRMMIDRIRIPVTPPGLVHAGARVVLCFGATAA